MPKNGTIKLSLELSEEVNAQLEALAKGAHTSKSEILRRSLGLYDIAAEAKGNGLKLGLLNKDREIVTEVVGI